jgi:site-specific recombinase XerD
MNIAEAIQQFEEHRHIKGVKEKTLKTHRIWFNIWSQWRKQQQYQDCIAAITVEEFRAFFKYLRNEHQTRRGGQLGDYSLLSTWRSLRALWNYLALEMQLTAEQERFFPDRIPMPKVDEEIRPVYTPDMFDALLAACASPSEEQESRNRTLLLMLADSGMRANEVCEMKLSNLEEAQRQAKIMGKGRKMRYVFWSPATAAELGRYLAIRRQRETSHDAIFCELWGEDALTYNALRCMIRRLAKRAGVELPKGASIQALRVTFARNALEKGMEGLYLQQLMGHSDIRTTSRYVREAPAPLKKAYDKIFNPE